MDLLTHHPTLELAHPWMNAAGMLGFAYDERALAGMTLGAFVTNPISRAPRSPARSRGVYASAGSSLVHSGLPNPGLSAVIADYEARWAASPLPVIPHVLADSAGDVQAMVERLEALGACAAVEVGLPEGLDEDTAMTWVQAALGELPVIARVAMTEAGVLGSALAEAGADAVSLGAPRGAVRTADGEVLGGRLYGPALYPLALQATSQLARAGVRVIAAGGVDSREKGEALLAAGALAVQVDVALWRGGVR